MRPFQIIAIVTIRAVTVGFDETHLLERWMEQPDDRGRA
jgi:hypothetical protein